MTAQVLEAVPNFSEGRDLAVLDKILEAVSAAGATVLDWSADEDHHRSVFTLVGTPGQVEEATVAGARSAFEHIDLRQHDGVHPRVGALDVLPFVPLVGLTIEQADAVARRVGQRIVDEFGVPVYFYGHTSTPPGRPLAAIRKGGFEALVNGWPDGRLPDVMPAEWPHAGAHPRSGVCCVGARTVLLAWNVFVAGLTYESAKRVAASMREEKSGLRGVRALALQLPRRGALQISMNLEDPTVTPPVVVFNRLELLIQEAGGAVTETEIIGLMPDQLALSVAQDRMKLQPGTEHRLLSHKLLQYIAQPIPVANLDE